MHVRLSSLVSDDALPLAKRAADAVADQGGSPRAQIDAARQALGKHLVYKPHCGAKERAKALKRAAKNG